MKKLSLLILALVLMLNGIVSAQDLRIPNTPAFSILDYEPASVMRPTSAKKLSSDIMSSFDAKGNLIMNLGMEVTPYWLKSRPKLTRAQYLNPDFGQTFLQTFTLSAATVKDTVTGKNNLGVGFRFELIKGNVTKKLNDAEKEELEIETIISAVSAQKFPVAAATIAVAEANINAALTGISASKLAEVSGLMTELKTYPLLNTPGKFVDKLLEIYSEQSRIKTLTIRELENKRTGFSLEFAGASKFVNESENQKFSKAGAWLNANYYMSEKDAWTITARHMWTTSDTTSVNTDIGLSYIRQENDFNVSVEGLLRWYRTEIPDFNLAGDPIIRLEKDLTYRLAAQISYTIVNNISLNLSIGKDFEDAKFERSGIFSILGINYSVFSRQGSQ